MSPSALIMSGGSLGRPIALAIAPTSPWSGLGATWLSIGMARICCARSCRARRDRRSASPHNPRRSRPARRRSPPANGPARHLDAHLGALGAQRMADIVGRRQADRQDVGLRPWPSFMSWTKPAAIASTAAPRRRGETRNGLQVARRALEPAGAQRLAADRDRRSSGLQKPGSGMASCGRAIRSATALRVRSTTGGHGASGIGDIGLAVPPPDLVHLVAAHHHGGAVFPRPRRCARGDRRSSSARPASAPSDACPRR